jgi:hypothetical protein
MIASNPNNHFLEFECISHVSSRHDAAGDKPMTVEHLLSAKSLAERIGVTEGCLAKWRGTGEGIRFVRVGRRIMYAPADIAEWLDARRVNSTSAEAA